MDQLLESENVEPEIVKATVAQEGALLQFASDEFKDDKPVVLAAVGQNGWAIQYASRSKNEDEDIIKIAKQQEKLQYAPKDVVIRAVFELSLIHI